MNNRIFLLSTILFLFIGVSHQTSAATDTSAEQIIKEETIIVADLEVDEPTFLPSSRFYFFKNFTRGVKRFFTFNPIKKAELELQFADEKIAETKKLAEKEPGETGAIERAVENYRASQERLQTQFQRLKETSQNPNVDKLLEKLADRTIKHEKLFAELKEKFEGNKELEKQFEQAKEELEENIAKAAEKDDPKKFAKKLERALVETRGSDLKHMRSLEIIDRIHQKAPEELQKELSGIREDFSERLKEDLEAFVKKHEATPELVQEVLKELPGEKARRLIIIEELQEKAERRVKEVLKASEKVLEKVFEEQEELMERAKEALQHAQERLEKLEEKLKKISSPFTSADRLAENAKSHLEEAIRAFENKKYGEAFGLARSAEVLARNALRIFEEREEPEDEDLTEDIAELEERLNGWEKRMESLSEEFRQKAKEALENSRLHLRLARENLEKDALREAKKHYEEAKKFERSLERIFKESFKGSLRQKGDRVPAAAASPLPTSATATEKPKEERKERATDPQRSEEVTKQEATELQKVPAITPTPPAAEVKESTPSDASQSGTIEPVTLKIEADDNGFYPQNSLTVSKGSKVSLTFVVRKEGVYYGGLDFRSSKFKTETVKPGGSTSVEFTADESFRITSYWPLTDTRKADLQIEIK